MREIKLKPCPFCGSKAEIHSFLKKAISCTNDSCPCMPMTCSKLFETQEAAIKGWNRRHKVVER